MNEHRVECPECDGAGRTHELCQGGQGCSNCDRPCHLCNGRGTTPGFLTCDGEVVDGALAREIHFGGDPCVIEDCVWCARELAEAKAMYGAGGTPDESSETYREQMIDAGRGGLLRN